MAVWIFGRTHAAGRKQFPRTSWSGAAGLSTIGSGARPLMRPQHTRRRSTRDGNDAILVPLSLLLLALLARQTSHRNGKSIDANLQ